MPHPLELIQRRSIADLTGELRRLVRYRLWAQVLVALVLGLAAGLALGPEAGWVPPPTARTITAWLALPGSLFLAVTRMVILPLVFASLVRGLAASENPGQLRRLGMGGFLYFLLTTVVATTLGIGLALVLRPGDLVDPGLVRETLGTGVVAPGGAADLPGLEEVPARFIALLPANPLAAAAGGEMFQVVLFGIIFGIAMISIPAAKSAPLFDVLDALQQVSMKIVSWAMLLAPFAVFGLIARLTALVGFDVLRGMAAYVGTVILGLVALVGFDLLLVAFVARRNPLGFLRDIREVVLLAFSTSSSAAVMPLSVRTAVDSLGVRESVARFLVPLGATINMDGTALYQGVATVFLAQVFDVPLSTTALVLVVVTAIAASIGSPATPGAGIVILAMVLESAGIPVAGIALLLGVDRILDMCRTAVNATGDLTGCVVLDRFVGGAADPEPSG